MKHTFVYIVLAVSILCNIGQVFWPFFVVERSVVHNVRRTTYHQQEYIAGLQVTPGARKIFIDLGANDGRSTSYFLDTPVTGANGGNIATQGGEEDSFLRGLGSSRDWEVVVVEANINFTTHLRALQARAVTSSSVKDFRVYCGTAIAKTSGTITFIIDNPRKGSTGATTMSESLSAVGPNFTIPAIGIADLFYSLKVHQNDFVVVKMDIEGYEFELMRHMLTHGIHRRIDVLAVEYHDTNNWVFGRKPELRQKYQTYHKCIDWMLEGVNSMKVVKWG